MISAAEDGYEVQAVLDASGSPTPLSEDLAKDWSTPEGKQLAAIVADMVNPPVHMLAPSEGAPI